MINLQTYPLKFILIAFLFIATGWAIAQPEITSVHPLPPQTPTWLAGYAVRWPVRILGEVSTQTSKSVLVNIPTGGWLKSDASDIAVQTAAGIILPVAILSHDPTGDSIIQFKRNGNDPWYWVYGGNPKAPALVKVDAITDPTFKEGLTLELRDWAGDDLSSWAKVNAGLLKSNKIIGNAIVTEITQNCNPARPDVGNKFAASYRGFLNIKKEGTYNFFVNADEASFLFINGFKVFERPGSNRTLGQVKVKELEKIVGKVDLKVGVHPFEVHQVVGENLQARGACTLGWTTPDQPKMSLVHNNAISHPLYARVATFEKRDGSDAGSFSYGIDDTLESVGLKLFLVRFEADGNFKDPEKITWDFGDGTSTKGPSPIHVFFKEGDYLVTMLTGEGMPPFKRKIRVWPEPGDTSPLSLVKTIKTIESMEWKKLDVLRIREIFSFLQICEEPSRWPLLESVTQVLLAQKDLDLEMKTQLITARMEALTNLGKPAEALKLGGEVAPEFAKTPVLQVRLKLGMAAIHQYHNRDANAASKIYQAILDEHKRVEHPNLRLAAIRWGDMFAEGGDLARASDTYRIAATLGGEKFANTANTEATTRGALMRIAEQKLKAGEILATRQLLERMELEFPGRRIDGLYCFMRAETDRHIGKYEDALRNYEMIFKLPQWAGYRDRASLGIADLYFRMGELEKSLKWFGNLNESFPKFYEVQKCASMVKLIEGRMERIKNAKRPEEAFFKGMQTGFEPKESSWVSMSMPFPIVRAPSLEGSHAALIDIYPTPLGGLIDYVLPLKNLTPGTTYWAEIWYKDIFRPAPPIPHQIAYIHARLIADPSKEEVLAAATLHRSSHHQWHKLSFKLKAPLSQDCLFKLSFYNHTGVTLYDSLSIQPVSDRRIDSLVNFIEGGKTQQ